jgi:K+-sensing histidine kinase KdpD
VFIANLDFTLIDKRKQLMDSRGHSSRPELGVTVTLKSVDGSVELQVGDTGASIPEDQRDRVFERFHRIEGTHARTSPATSSTTTRTYAPRLSDDGSDDAGDV